MSGYMINRKVYKDIKKYDHKQMDDFLQNVYKNGFVDGKKKAVEDLANERMKDIERIRIDYEDLTKKLLTIEGVGVVKSAEIVEIVKSMLGGAGDD